MKNRKVIPSPGTGCLLSEVEKLFLQKVMFDVGVIPIEDPMFDMRIPLSHLSQEDAKKAKRKFRKLWRQCMKQEQKLCYGTFEKIQKHALETSCGFGKKIASPYEKYERKRLVFNFIWRNHIVPMIAKFKNIERPELDQT